MRRATDEQVRAAERRYVADRDAGMPVRQCPGYPLDHFCLALIPWTRRLCQFCEGTRAAEQAALVASRPPLPSVGEVLEDLDLTVVYACPCGGDAEAPSHYASLLHMTWLARERHQSAQAPLE